MRLRELGSSSASSHRWRPAPSSRAARAPTARRSGWTATGWYASRSCRRRGGRWRSSWRCCRPWRHALTGLNDWGDASLGHADFDLAIISAFCGPQTLQGVLDRLPDTTAARASAAIPFLVTVRWLQDAVHVMGRGGRPSFDRLRRHLDEA